MKKIVIGISSLCLAAVLGTGGYLFYQHPMKYISLDINPSVELGVNAFNTVVTAEGYNEDGQTILEGQDVLNTSVTDAVDTLVQSAADNGFIADDGTTIVAVTAETDNDADAAKLTDEAEQGVNTAIEESDKEAVVYKDNVALARRDEARQLGITPGKLNLIQKMQALDPTITVDQYKDAKVKDIMKKTIELRKAAKTTTDTSTTDTTDPSDDTTGTVTSETDAAYQGIEKAVQQAEKNKAEKVKGSKDVSSTTKVDSDDAQEPADTSTTAANKGNKDNAQGKSEDHQVTLPAAASPTAVTAYQNGADNRNDQSKTNNAQTEKTNQGQNNKK